MKEWHHKAIALKQGGASLAEIGRICGFSDTAARWATRNVQSPKTAGQHLSEAKRGKASPAQRKKMKETGGFRIGTLKRVAIAFTDEQFAFAANEADRLQTSFSKAVSDMVQNAMSKAQ